VEQGSFHELNNIFYRSLSDPFLTNAFQSAGDWIPR
jgi:hypothetical protein